MEVIVVVGVDERACRLAGAFEIGKALRRKGGMVLRGAEQGLCVSVVVAHPRAPVRRAEAEGTNGGLYRSGFQGVVVVPVQDDKSVH